MKELILVISLYDMEEIDADDLLHIREYLDGYFPNNKGIGHIIKTDVPDYKEIMKFLKEQYKPE